MGKVSERSVVLRRLSALNGSTWRPVFYGCFHATETGAALVGVFRLSTLTCVTKSLWFGFAMFWTVLAMVRAASASPNQLWFPLFGVAIIAALAATARSGRRAGESDISWLGEVIGKALET